MSKFKSIFALLVCLNLAACGTSSVERAAGKESYKNYGEKVEDIKILNFIRAKFRNDPLIPNKAIHLSVDRGIIQLSGFIMDYQEANLAVLSAQGAPGVKGVINNLIVLSSPDYAKQRGHAERYNIPK